MKIAQPLKLQETITDRNKTYLYSLIAAVTLFKVYMATHTIGSNDIYYWRIFMETLAKHDIVTIYRLIDIYNHPPFMSCFLLLLHKLTAAHPDYFPFLMRLPAIAADIGNSLLVYTLAKRLFSDRKATWAGALVAMSPILIMVSGFHGNTDPIFVFLVLSAVYLLLVKKNAFWAGLVFGCAFNIKIVPIICIPLFFFHCTTNKARIAFFSMMLLPLIAGFGYPLIKDPGGIIGNVFLYKSLYGNWGISKLLANSAISPEKIATISKIYILLLITGICYLLSRQGKGASEQEKLECALRNLGLCFLIFLVGTPGFSVQYLCWLAPTGIFLGIIPYTIFSLVAGTFLFAVYTFWSGGFPWYYADSLSKGTWVGAAETLDTTLWIVMVIWLLYLLVPIVRTFVQKSK